MLGPPEGVIGGKVAGCEGNLAGEKEGSLDGPTVGLLDGKIEAIPVGEKDVLEGSVDLMDGESIVWSSR